MWARNFLSRTTASFHKCTRPVVVTSPIRMASTLPRLPIFEAIKKHDAQRTAVIHSLSGRRFTYGELVNDVAAAKDKLQRNTGGKSAEGERISFLVENGYDYVGAHPVVSLPCVLQWRQPLTAE
jgi:malonyl-CoA/methylmalonyl-CoA synthetase